MNHKVCLLVGLGNPGPQYAGTRHNAGQDLVEELASRHGVTLTAESKFHGLTGRVLLGRCDLRLLIPTTFMNRSGQAVASVVNFYKLQPEEVLVVHDELDLPPGVARFKHGGGHGGHNGLRDIVSALGNNRDFSRLRIGIGHPGNSGEVTSFVLKVAPATEQDQITHGIDEALRVLPQAVAGEWPRATEALHRATPAIGSEPKPEQAD